jgi:four helix bundle protein
MVKKMSFQHIFPFEKLRVWQDSRIWLKGIYELTRKFPEVEKYGLTSQLTRAAVFVPTNLAEGSGRISKKDQAHFTHIAYSSLMECMNLLILACDQKFLSENDLEAQRSSIAGLSAQLNALHQSQRVRTE